MNRISGLAGGIAHRPLTVADQVSTILREAIVRGSLPGGVVLRQDELAETFGFSRMPIRDALRMLETEGLVTIHPTKGAFVTPMDAKEISEVYAIRELLEIEALRLSCPKLPAVAFQAAANILDKIDAENETLNVIALNTEFHLALYSACGNERLIGLIRQQHKAADRYVGAIMSDPDHQMRSQSEHRRLLQACEQRNTTKGAALLRGHLRGSNSLVAVVRNSEASR